jgi:hypothetical protein
MISKRSEASQMKRRRFWAFQKKGCRRTASAAGLRSEHGQHQAEDRREEEDEPFPRICRSHPQDQVLHFYRLLPQPVKSVETDLPLKNVHLPLVPSSKRVFSSSKHVVEDAPEGEDVDRASEAHARIC